MAGKKPRIEAVTRITLENFRGWGGTHSVAFAEGQKDGNAEKAPDIVLVTSANGRGKSSLIEAMCFILNGVAWHDQRALTTIRKDSFKLSIGTLGGPEEMAHDDERWSNRLDDLQQEGLTPPMLRRATSFFQDRVEDQFELSNVDDTLLKFLAPFPAWLDAYERAIDRRLRSWGADEPRVPPSSIDATIAEQQRLYESRAQTFLGEVVSIISPPLLGGTARERLQDLIGKIVSTTDMTQGFRELRRRIDEHARRSPETGRRIAEALARLDAARDELERHERAWQAIEPFLAWGGGPTTVEKLFELLDALAARAPGWLDDTSLKAQLALLPEESRKLVPSIEEASGLADEFKAVDLARAATYRNVVAAWRHFWLARQAEREACRKERDQAQRHHDDISEQITTSRAHRALADLEEVYNSLQVLEKQRDDDRRLALRWQRIVPLVEVLKGQLRLLGELRDRRLDDEARGKVEKSLGDVFKHFVVAGDPEFEVVRTGDDRRLEPALSDKRRLVDHFSTGQKAQTALAWLLTTNALLQEWLPHRLLLLDDVTTALDLTNLAAECMLLRKFAYSSSARRRQIVIASHHDQLTHRMFQLLLPPGNFWMREIRLLDWKLESGPTVESYIIKSTNAADDRARSKLAERLAQSIGVLERVP